MSDDEDDYMSDAILNKCGDSRPGLSSKSVAKQYQKQQIAKTKNQAHSMKPMKQMEAEKRESGLNQAIGADNKGFSLLSKMGYKPGMAMGKKGQGRSEPVPIVLPQGRSGLGMVAEKRKRQEQVAVMKIQMLAKRKKYNENQQKDFRSFHSNKHAEKLLERDLSKSQRVCEQLDLEQGDGEPSESYFWPERKYHGEEEEEEEEEAEEEEEETEEELLTMKQIWQTTVLETLLMIMSVYKKFLGLACTKTCVTDDCTSDCTKALGLVFTKTCVTDDCTSDRTKTVGSVFTKTCVTDDCMSDRTQALGLVFTKTCNTDCTKALNLVFTKLLITDDCTSDCTKALRLVFTKSRWW